MVIHIKGGGFVNKGAELMLISVVNRLRKLAPDSLPVIEYNLGTKDQRRALGLGDLLWKESSRVPGAAGAFNAVASATRWIPRPRGRHVGKKSRVLPSDVSLVLDISGFAYGDQWGPENALRAARYYMRIRRAGGRVVLMPQQLGPFDDERVREAFSMLSRSSDLIFARDRLSYECAASVVEDQSILHQAPDFTVLQKGDHPANHEMSGRVCIVPNYKMLQETSGATREAYPNFLSRCVRFLRQRDIEPVVLIHQFSGRDHDVVKSITGPDVTIFEEPDPLKVKGIIGTSPLMIGSRFHGLVSALSQGVPALGTGWSHKYAMLFDEFGCPENLLDPTLPDEELESAFERVLGSGRENLTATLRERRAAIESRVIDMWDKIDHTVFI